MATVDVDGATTVDDILTELDAIDEEGITVDVDGETIVEDVLTELDVVDKEGVTLDVDGYGSYTANTTTALVNKKTIRTYCSFITILFSHPEFFISIDTTSSQQAG